ncbi:hypothetical protein [Microbacterium halophytorum]|uniref:hypothetical protein n=1 Tax=Microbacterium halophytorum TaxID=2067568 RepID=UPI000CFC736F|nr:hypothetical protein [Microbacterium halophytorum]
MAETDEPPMIVEAELRAAIAAELVAVAPAGWVRIVLSAASVGGVTDALVTAELAGADDRSLAAPSGTAIPLSRLRRALYRRDRGTWFSMELVVGSDGSAEAKYDYDNPPRDFAALVPRLWLADQQRFPRSPEHRPDWLHAKLMALGSGRTPPVGSSLVDDTLTEAARFGERLAFGTGLMPSRPLRDRIVELSDGEVGYAVIPTEGGFELQFASRGTPASVAFATRLDDAMRLMAADLYPAGSAACTPDALPPHVRFETTPRDVSVSWTDDEGRARTVRVWGLSMPGAKAVRVALWAETGLDEIGDVVGAPR